MIIPALLTTTERVAQERITLAQHMSGWLHIDILDNTLYQFDALPLSSLEALDFGGLSLEFHAMVNEPLTILESSLTVDRLIIHYEAPRWESSYVKAVSKGIDTWVAIDPKTKLTTLSLPEDIGGIVVMGVVPGQSGQAFLEETYSRIETLKDYHSDVPLTVDGGVGQDNLRALIAHGVDNVIMGSAIFSQKDPVETYHKYVALSDPIGGTLHDLKTENENLKIDD
jgi:ribulose-phosphate 3-epimerase